MEKSTKHGGQGGGPTRREAIAAAASATGMPAIRSAARAAKDFARADAIRNQLAAMGVLLEDGKDGVKILMKQPEE